MYLVSRWVKQKWHNHVIEIWEGDERRKNERTFEKVNFDSAKLAKFLKWATFLKKFFELGDRRPSYIPERLQVDFKDTLYVSTVHRIWYSDIDEIQ